jgi:hypothetical protein
MGSPSKKQKTNKQEINKQENHDKVAKEKASNQINHALEISEWVNEKTDGWTNKDWKIFDLPPRGRKDIKDWVDRRRDPDLKAGKSIKKLWPFLRHDDFSNMKKLLKFMDQSDDEMRFDTELIKFSKQKKNLKKDRKSPTDESKLLKLIFEKAEIERGGWPSSGVKTSIQEQLKEEQRLKELLKRDYKGLPICESPKGKSKKKKRKSKRKSKRKYKRKSKRKSK